MFYLAAPADFDSNTVTFNSVLEGCFPFDINSDLEEEDDETVIVSLQLIPVGGTAFTTTASVVIIDNDGELNSYCGTTEDA